MRGAKAACPGAILRSGRTHQTHSHPLDPRSVGCAADGDRGAAGVLLALRSLSTQLSGAQVGITVTNLAIGFLAEPAIADLLDGPLTSLGLPAAGARSISIATALIAARTKID